MNSIRTLSLKNARQLAITRQRLAGARPRADANGIMEIARDLRCLQIDPTSAVARSHLLVLWSRLGPYDRAELDKLLWQEHALFEYWAHAASIVLTEDYPIHNLMMRQYPGTDKRSDTGWSRRVRDWMAKNETLRRKILSELRRNGPMLK